MLSARQPAESLRRRSKTPFGCNKRDKVVFITYTTENVFKLSCIGGPLRSLPHSLMCQYENENVFKHVIRNSENLNYNYVDDFHFI